MTNPHMQTCPVASFLNLFGDTWTLLILREAFYGTARFSEFQRNTGIAKNLLSERLSRLVEDGIFEKVNVGERGQRYAYELTAKGRSLAPVFVAISQWGNEHIYGKGKEATILVEQSSGKRLETLKPTTKDGKSLRWEQIRVTPGPGASESARARLLEADDS